MLFYGIVIANAQQIVIEQKVNSFPGNYTTFSIDNMGNIYLLNTSNQFIKRNANGDSVSVFNDIKRYGIVSTMDVSNPLKIVLYYKGFATIVFLDGMLNIKNKIDLRKKGILSATATGLSYDGKIWLYDDMDNALKKLDDGGNTVLQTADFRQLFGKALTPVKIFDQNQYVYLYDSLQGIYVFDYYGAYKNRINITQWDHLYFASQYIFGVYQGQLHRYNIHTLKEDTWKLPVELEQCNQLYFKNNSLYALDSNGVAAFRIAIQ